MRFPGVSFLGLVRKARTTTGFQQVEWQLPGHKLIELKKNRAKVIGYMAGAAGHALRGPDP